MTENADPTPEDPPKPKQPSGIVRTGQLIRSALRKVSGFSWRRDWAEDDPDEPKVVARVKPTNRHEESRLPAPARYAIIAGVVLLILAGIWVATRLASQAPVVPDSLF